MAQTLRASAHHDHHLGARVRAAVADFRAAVARYRSYRRTVAELVALSDRELADMGMHRSNIYAIAREHAYDK